ncbi:PTS transporter subunit EIIC, partial [Rossellomorea marisflavi]
MKFARTKNVIQQFGRSLLLPIAVMAPIGMIMGITGALGQEYMIEKLPFLDHVIIQTIINSLRDISSVVFNNIPLLFAMGVAYGMSKNEKGIAVFASVLGYLTLLIVMNVYLTATGTLEADPEKLSQMGQGVILGIQTLRIDA